MGILAGEASERETGCRVVVDLSFDLQVCYWDLLYSFMVKQCTLGDIIGR